MIGVPEISQEDRNDDIIKNYKVTKNKNIKKERTHG